MSRPTARDLKLALMLSWALGLAAPQAYAADEADAPPKGAAVTVFKAAKSCFGNNVEVSGTIIARADELAGVPLAAARPMAEILRLVKG